MVRLVANIISSFCFSEKVKYDTLPDSKACHKKKLGEERKLGFRHLILKMHDKGSNPIFIYAPSNSQYHTAFKMARYKNFPKQTFL